MGILNIQAGFAGADNIEPRLVFMDTNNTVAEILATGYLNSAVQAGFYSPKESDMCLVTTKTSPSATSTEAGWYEISISGSDYSLVPGAGAGSVVLPTVANQLIHATNTTGELSSDAVAAVTHLGAIYAGASGTAGVLRSYSSTASRGYLEIAGVANTGNTAVTVSNAAHGQASVISIPDGGQAASEFIIADSAGTQHITSGSLQVDAGDISGGLLAGGFAGSLILWANTTASGNLQLLAVDNGSGDFDTVISNAAAVGQDQTITIPDSGASTANFLLDTGAANIIAHQEFVGIANFLLASAGTWTTTRVAQGDIALRHTAADDTSILVFDVTPQIRAAASKGFRLDSFDVMYSITSLALDAHSITLDRIEYADNTAVSVNSISITGALATATQANPYLTNVAVDSPAFDVTADSKYVLELTVDAGATSDYDFLGFMLRFSETIG